MANKKRQANKITPKKPEPGRQTFISGKNTTQSPKPKGFNLFSSKESRTQLLIVAGIALFVFLFFKTCLNNQLTNWDDDDYLVNNPLVKDASSDGIMNIFFGGKGSYSMGNYHPFTILSYAIEYSYVKAEPFLYHFDSLLLHILTTVLVYWFVKLLSGRTLAAAIAALLFGLHPMHVESVAWVAGRKDLLCGVFFMASCICYVYYLRAKGTLRWRYYTGVLVLFLCSLLSKSIAVTLPVTFLLIDYFENRKWSYAILIEKIPHFALALIFGLISIDAQKSFGALGSINIEYSLIDKILLGSYAFVTYLWKAIAPVNLSCLYPYPGKVNGSFPGILYLYPLVIIALIGIIALFARKNRTVIFGALFFFVNIALLLRFVSVGRAVIADRYTYIPYFGLFFIVGWLVSLFYESTANKQLRYAILTVSLVCCGILGFMSSQRCEVWYDSMSLWRDVINKNPQNSPIAYNNLGCLYYDKWTNETNLAEKKTYYDSVYYLLNKAIDQLPGFEFAYLSLAKLEKKSDPDAAKRNYYEAIKINPKSAEAYWELAVMYSISKNFDSGGVCFKKALEIQSVWPEVHSDYGNYLNITGKYDSAIQQFGIAINQNPQLLPPYLNRGRVFQYLNRNDEAVKDFGQAINLAPDNGQAYYLRSISYFKMGDKIHALQDVKKALSLGYNAIDKSYYDQLQH